MQLEDIQQITASGGLSTVDGVNPSSAILHQGRLCVAGLVALPIAHVSSSLDRSEDSEVVDEFGLSVGTLCLTSKLAAIDPTTLTRWQYVAYLTDVESSGAGQAHTFSCNYIVLNANFVEKYLEQYARGAPIWGGFSHKFIAPATTESRPTITAIPSIILPTAHHEMSLSRYVAANNAFDRFLRLYHTIELLFDFLMMKSIQQLGDDLGGFGNIIRSYGTTELDRLKHIIFTYCDNAGSIADKIALVAAFEPKAEEIFQDHTKNGNPLDQPGRWSALMALCLAGQTAEADLQKPFKIQPSQPYAKLVANIAAYWIYRVRSSIAHSRVSEFLFMETDEPFVAEFAEKLLLEVARQIFSSTKLSALVST